MKNSNLIGMKALSVIMPWPWFIMKEGKDEGYNK
jgi:hypothetical protein